jgi:hypothetical protein
MTAEPADIFTFASFEPAIAHFHRERLGLRADQA